VKRDDRQYDPADEFLRRYVAERMKGYQPGDIDALTERFEARLRERHRRRFLPLKAAVAVVAVIAVAGATFLLSSPERLLAVGKRVFSSRITFQDDTGRLSFGESESKQPAHDPSSLTTEELKKRVDFTPFGPSYIPPGYCFKGHSVTKIGEHEVRISSHYESNGQFLTVRQTLFRDGEIGPSFDLDDTVVSDVSVRGIPGKLLYREKDRWGKVVWAEGDMLFEVSGRLPAEELLKVSNSMGPL